MSDLNLNNRSPLTVEDLLRLKRAERPSPEFWAGFERELRQKQLAALLERRPWWQTLPQLLTQRKTLVPLGASAIIAFALISAKLYTPVPLSKGDSSESSGAVSSMQIEPPVVADGTLERSETVPPIGSIGGREAKLNESAFTTPTISLSEHLPEHAVGLTPWNAPLPAQSIPSILIATGEQLERNDARLPRQLISNSLPVATSRIQRLDGAVSELASVSALASKRTRLLAQFNDRQFTPEPQAPASIRERLTRHLSDVSFSEHYSRLGLKGDQVSLRF